MENFYMALVKDAVSFHFTQSLFALLEKKQINKCWQQFRTLE